MRGVRGKIGQKIQDNSGVNKSARERIGRQNWSQKVPSKKRSLGVIFPPRSYRENAHSKSANFEERHSGGHLLGRPLLFTSGQPRPEMGKTGQEERKNGIWGLVAFHLRPHIASDLGRNVTRSFNPHRNRNQFPSGNEILAYGRRFKSQPASTRCDLRIASPTRPF